MHGGGEISRAARRLEQATWAFVALGVLLRIARYAMNYPLWWDEAFVAVNFIRRGYVDLLRPLDYGQVCPVLFLWAELTFVKLLGFSEWSLRLFPLGCAVASVVLFRHVASRVVSGVPLLLAVAIFAVSYHPIRHAADVKPYASDLLVSLALAAAALEWLRSPQQARWIWVFSAVAPVARCTLSSGGVRCRRDRDRACSRSRQNKPPGRLDEFHGLLPERDRSIRRPVRCVYTRAGGRDLDRHARPMERRPFRR